jgi:hypothetical protein
MTPDIVFVQGTVSVRNTHTDLLVTLHEGEAWWADDPFVRLRPEFFGAVPPKIRGERPALVEQASKVPGEKRTVKRA